MMIDPNDPPDVQIRKQAKIIEALMSRANRQRDVGPSAFRAFQSAIELQQQVAAQSRDLERAATEVESARYERERTRRNLVEALSSMDEGFALFSDGQLDLCNELFRDVLPDIAAQVRPGLRLERFIDMVRASRHFQSSDPALQPMSTALREQGTQTAAFSTVVELSEDRWYQLNGQRTSSENIVLLMTDISALVRRNRDEKETLIDRQSDYLQAVFQNMSPGVCTCSVNGELRMHNGRFRTMLGLPEEMVEPGTPLVQMLDYMLERRLIDKEQQEQVESWRHELNVRGWLRKRVRHWKGRVLDIQANTLPDGGFVVELKDVSLEARTTQLLENRVMERTAELTRANEKLVREYDEKARVEEELRLAKERAEAAVSSKTRFLAAASHDLLQPINAAKLLISTLRKATQKTEFSPMLERLDGAFGSAEQLLHSLLDISRLESPDPDAVSPTDVCLGPIMEGVHTDQTLLAEQKGVKLDMVPSSAFVHSDPVYLLRSIQNLVVNAIQYTESGGRVLFGCRQRGDKIVLEVWDTGIGIASKDQVRIFEAFARAGDMLPGSGMGLGLSVVDRACRLLGHTLSVRSAPDKGSVFSIEMNRVAGKIQSLEPTRIHPGDTFPLEHIVQVIENDPVVLNAMTKWLEQWGASVLPASSTREAVEQVNDMGMAPDIILADYQLNGVDTGVIAITRVREMTGVHVPAILITANRSESVWQAGAQHDVSVMTKPAELTRLRALIDWKIRWQPRTHEADNQSNAPIPTKVGGD